MMKYLFHFSLSPRLTPCLAVMPEIKNLHEYFVMAKKSEEYFAGSESEMEKSSRVIETVALLLLTQTINVCNSPLTKPTPQTPLKQQQQIQMSFPVLDQIQSNSDSDLDQICISASLVLDQLLVQYKPEFRFPTSRSFFNFQNWNKIFSRDVYPLNIFFHSLKFYCENL
ncbi:hypothetical protein FF38_13195 [Lucilia cuprina]|uniref:Uncharacterized protein n=1 Tax=Lucilia cuprina TaxID=7375 RepID=A0A0L0CK66_LUCCU|nr:hypothetical protein FF38_13195 [Lucilia cuprina]